MMEEDPADDPEMKKERISNLLLFVCALLGAILAFLPLIELFRNPYLELAGILVVIGNLIMVPVGWVVAVILYQVIGRILRLPIIHMGKVLFVCAVFALCASFPVVNIVLSMYTIVKTTVDVSNFHVTVSDIRESFSQPTAEDSGIYGIQTVYEVTATIRNTGKPVPTHVNFYVNGIALTRVSVFSTPSIPTGTSSYVGRVSLRPSMLEEIEKKKTVQLSYSFDPPYDKKIDRITGNIHYQNSALAWPAPDPAIVKVENARIKRAQSIDFDSQVQRGLFSRIPAVISLSPLGAQPNIHDAVTSEVNGKAVWLTPGDELIQLYGIRNNNPNEYLVIMYALLGPLNTLSTAKLTKDIPYDLNGIRIVNEKGVPVRMNAEGAKDFVDLSLKYGSMPQTGMLKHSYDFDQWGLGFYVPTSDFANPQKSQKYSLTYEEGSIKSSPITITIRLQ